MNRFVQTSWPLAGRCLVEQPPLQDDETIELVALTTHQMPPPAPTLPSFPGPVMVIALWKISYPR